MEAEKITTTLREDLTELLDAPRELWIIYGATFFEYLGIFSLLPTLTLWLSQDFGFSDERAGWWAAAFSTVLTLLVFLIGAVADFIGVRRTLLLGFAIAAATRLFMASTTTSTWALISLFSFALAYASISPVLQTAVQRVSTPRTRSFAFSLWYVSFNIAGVFAGQIIDLSSAPFVEPGGKKLIHRIIELPLLGPTELSAHRVILALGSFFAACAFVTILFLRKDFEHRGTERQGTSELLVTEKKPNPFVALREVFGDATFWRFILMMCLISLVRMMFQHMHFTWPKYVTRELGEDFKIGTVWSINAFLIIFLAPLGTALTRGRRPLDVLLVGAFISSLSPFILCLGSALPYQIAMILVLTVGEALWSPRLYEYNVSIAPRGRESTYVSLAQLPWFMAKFFVGPTSGILLTAFCPAEGARRSAILWAIIGLSTMLGPVGIFALRGWLTKKREVAEPT